MKTILVATDGSAGAESAVSAAVQLAAETGAELHCVGVDDALAHEGIDPAAAATAEAAAAAARDAGVTATAERRIGPAAERILDAARDCGADLIVVGSRGRGWLKGTVFGSISAALVRQATVPVLVVKTATRLQATAPAVDAGPPTAASASDAAPAAAASMSDAAPAAAAAAPAPPEAPPVAPARRPLVAVELPGMKPDDVQLEVADDSLVVRAHRAISSQGGVATEERVYARFALPRGTDAEDLAASLADGILTVTLTAPAAAPVPVPVGPGAASG